MQARSATSLLCLLLLSSSAFAATPAKQTIIWANHARTFALYLADSDGTNERPFLPQLTSRYNASFSWDGQWIVFTSEQQGSADVFRAHPDGSALDPLTDNAAFDDQGALSPDGRMLAFVSTREGGTANIWVLDIAGHRARNLTHNKAGNFRPSWSPDGEWIAFSSDRGMPRLRYIRDTGAAWELMQTTAIYIVHPDGSGLARLTALEGCAGSPRWSPDSRRVIFNEVVDVEAMRHFRARTRIVSVDVDTRVREVHSDGTKFAWSPAFVSNTEIGYLQNDPSYGQGTSLVYTSGRNGPVGAESLSWSPDGALLVYEKKMDVEEDWTKARSSRDPRYELVGGAAFANQDTISFSRTGEQFVYRPPKSQRLKLIDWNGAGPVVFDGDTDDRRIANAALSADGRSLAVSIWSSRYSAETGQIALVDSDRSHFRVVTHDEGHDDYPSFSPDDTKLVYRLGKYEERQHTAQGLRVVSLADGKVTRLTTGWDSHPTWSPRGDRIAFTGFETGDFEIYTIRPNGTGLQQLTHTHGDDAHPVWSPDGEWVAFVSSRMGWKDEALRPWHGPQAYGEIFVMRSDGTDVRQLTDNQWEEGVLAWPAAR